jgi:hypothetical protein
MSEVHTFLKIIAHLSLTPCSVVRVYQHPKGIACFCLQGRKAVLLVNSEDRRSWFLQIVSKSLPDYMASHPTRH